MWTQRTSSPGRKGFHAGKGAVSGHSSYTPGEVERATWRKARDFASAKILVPLFVLAPGLFLAELAVSFWGGLFVKGFWMTVREKTSLWEEGLIRSIPENGVRSCPWLTSWPCSSKAWPKDDTEAP